MRTRGAAMFLIAAAIAPRPITAHAADPVPVVTKVDTVGLTVSDMDRAVDFYTSVLTFEKISDVEAAGRAYELMEGVFGARMRIVRLRLGGETIELTEYLAPKG